MPKFKVSQAPLTKYDAQDREVNYEIMEKGDPRSAFNLASPALQEAMHRIPLELLQMSEPELEREVKPDLVTCRLRIAFWMEYEHAKINNKDDFRMFMLYNGVCTKVHFYHTILHDPKKLAWIIMPPSDYLLAMKEILDQGVKQLRKIIMGNVVDAHGNINTRAAEQVIKAMSMVDLKLFGGAVIRTENKTISKTLHMHQAIPAPGPNDVGQDLQEVQKQIDLYKDELGLTAKSEKVVEAVLVDEGTERAN